MTRMNFGWGLVFAVLVFACGVFAFRPAAEAQRTPDSAAAGARYTVVDTEGTNLLVVDNGTNTLYFYTVNPDQEVGADLHLRGSIDLKEVGKQILKPRKMGK